MPRLIPQSNRLVSTVSVLVLFMLVLFTGIDAGAQRRRRPAQKAPQQQDAANTNTAPAQGKSQKKNITPLRGGDTPDGSRLTITSDVPLNDYSAYRSGDRYYVEIPDANAPRAASGLRGRGFEDVQVQKRGDNAVISFKLQPGATARVSQKFNRLDVELSAPGRSTASVSPTPAPTPATAATQPTPRSTPQTPTTTPTPAIAAQANQTPPGITGANTTPGAITPGAETIPPITSVQPPDASASPGASPEASPLATPPSDVVAQAQPQPETQPVTQPASAAPSSSLGATLARNWMLILIVGVVLASLVLLVALRSRAQGRAATATPVRRVSRKERRAARAKASEKLSEAATSEDAAAAKSAIVLKPGTLPKAVKIDKVEETPAVAIAEETKEVEPVTAVDVERIELEVKNLLGGESYDEALIGSSEAETRQLVATELLSALASRNVERRERARTAFVKHDYLDEATRNLRTAGAAAERASAARSLGYVADRSTTPHLIAALEDDAPEVRRAAVEALAEMGDPSASEPLQSLLKRERDKKVPLSLIERAISASTAVVEVEEAPAPASVQPVAEQEETTLETAPVVIDEADKPPAVETMGLMSEAATTAVVEEEEAVTEVPEVEPSVAAITAAELAAAEAAAQREKEEEAERLRAEEEERQRLEAEARRSAEEEEFRLEAARLEQEERERLAREQAAREEQERAEAEARRKAEEEEAARLKAEEEERRLEEEKRLAAEAEAKRQAEEEAARLRAEEEERQRVEEETRLAAEAEAARIRAEEEAEARRKAEEQERRRVEEEQRLAAEATAAEEARLRAEAEEQRRVEAEQRRAEEKARLAAAAEAQRKAAEEAEARRRAEEEARRAAEAEAEAQRKAEEEAEAARLRAEEEAARLKAEEEARLKAEAEAAEAQRKAEEEAERLRAEENARRLAAEEAAAALQAEAISPVEHDVAEPVEASSPALPFEPAIERNGSGVAEGWVEVDVAEPEVVRQAEPVKASTSEAAVESEALPEEAVVLEPSLASPAAVEEPTSTTKEIEYAVTEKGVDIFDENTTVPRAILRRLSSEEPDERASAVIDLARVGGDDSFREINAAFDDPAIEVRNAAARSLFNVHTDRAATFTRALREAPPERRRKIGAALASSGLASEAIGQLMGESREKTYDAFSLLFLMSKAGEVQPLMRAIEEHPNNEVRLAVIKLLALSGQQEILPAFRRLAVRGSLPTEVRSAVMEAIYQLSSQSPTAA